ncbi:TlpA disulfide reductase family protein [Leeuwenhoekiella sp. H156]|uniref:TlpA disulfide reductase family protein n=1 Tax=Leeuwenhoekiella sp. H156 TaxID=3450128 RepID=UPI003FA41540
MRPYLFFMAAFLALGCTDATKGQELPKPVKVYQEQGYKLPVYDYEHFKPFLKVTDTDVVRVINFWATWCKPCLAELPAFETLQANYKDKQVEVILVSLDFPDQVKERLIPFILKKQLKSKVLLLDDPHGDVWIPQVSEEWSGAIPATIILTSEEYRFYERSFEYPALEHELLSLKSNFND